MWWRWRQLQTGAQHLTAEERADMANDPLELLAADGVTDSAKGDADAASWLPPRRVTPDPGQAAKRRPLNPSRPAVTQSRYLIFTAI
jgi:hypothetical protein